MAFLFESDSSFTRSTTIELTTISQNHNKKWRAPVWTLCRRPTEDENQDLFYCSRCPLNSDKPPYGTDKSENMKKHLFKRHEMIILKQPSKN
jgi:hypothetical protein